MKGEHRGDRKACLPSPIMPMWTDFMLLWDDTLGGGSVGHVKVWYLICTVHRNLGSSVACNLRVSGVQIVIVCWWRRARGCGLYEATYVVESCHTPLNLLWGWDGLALVEGGARGGMKYMRCWGCP